MSHVFPIDIARLLRRENVLRLQEPKNEQRRLKEREPPPSSRAAEDRDSPADSEDTETPPITPVSEKQRLGVRTRRVAAYFYGHYNLGT